MAAWRTRQRFKYVVFAVFVFILFVLFRDAAWQSTDADLNRRHAHTDNDVEMVVASMKRENLTWLDDYLLDWKKNIYVVDDPTAPLTVAVNKGREAMVFLT